MSDQRHVPLDGEIRDGRHVLTVRVYYEDTDFTGIVYHANYLRYMERGRTNYLRLLGTDHRVLFEETEKEAPGFAFVVRSMNDRLSQAGAHGRRAGNPYRTAGGQGRLDHAAPARHARRRAVGRGSVRVAFVSGGRARPIPKPLRVAMKADLDTTQC